MSKMKKSIFREENNIFEGHLKIDYHILTSNDTESSSNQVLFCLAQLDLKLGWDAYIPN